MTHKLSYAQQKRLMLVGNARPTGEKNPALDAEIAAIKEVNPNAFHDENSVFARVFYNEPSRHVPFKSFIISNAKSKF